MPKSALLPTPADLTLDEISRRFNTDALALEYLEAILWPTGPVCPHCGNINAARIWTLKANEAKGIRLGLRHCAECNKHFRVTVGTIFEDSKIPLRKWLVAWYMVCSSKKGVSSLQLKRQLKLGSYRTALFMTHRIRHALKDPSFSAPLPGPVEVDETYVGGKTKGKGAAYKGNKATVVSLVSRSGEKRSFHVANVNSAKLKEAIYEHVEANATIMTDESNLYSKIGHGYRRKAVKHSVGEYVRGDAHTNTVESSFALLKRGVYGTFHNISKKHLHLYLAEFDHRWNHRTVTDGERTVAGVKKAKGKRLTYKQPKEGQSPK